MHILAGILIYYINMKVDDFNAFNARSHLKKLTGFGPRPAGSYANDIQAVAFLR